MWKVSALLLVLFALSATAGRGRKRGCPRTQDKFNRRWDKCWDPLFFSGGYDPDEPAEECPMRKWLLDCVEELMERCTHRPWAEEKMRELAVIRGAVYGNRCSHLPCCTPPENTTFGVSASTDAAE